VAGVLALSVAVFTPISTRDVARAADSSTPWAYSGLIDGYYLYDGNVPQGKGTTQITFFDYDQRASTPTLSLAELNITKAPPATGGIGFKTTLIAGDTAGLNVTGTQEQRYENVQQLYLTYTEKSGAGADIGKFYTPFGYEVTESNANYNYSRSWIYAEMIPVYHAGIRVYSPNYKGLVATGYLVKSLLNSDGEGVYDDNKSYGYIGQLNYAAPCGKLNAVETYGGSHDYREGDEVAVLLSDTDLTFTPDAVNTYGFNYANEQLHFVNMSIDETFSGYAGYYRRQITAPYAVAFRAEKLFASSGSRSAAIDSLTLTLEDKTSKSLLTRIEFRHDDGPHSEFVSGSNTAAVATQNTISLSAVYTFAG